MGYSTAISSIMAADLDFMVQDQSSTLVWSGQTITGTCSDIQRTANTEPDGMMQESDIEWVGTIADFTGSVLPAERATVQIDSVKYWIDRRVTDGVIVHLYCRRIQQKDD